MPILLDRLPFSEESVVSVPRSTRYIADTKSTAITLVFDPLMNPPARI